MQIVLYIFDKLLPFFVSKKIRLANEIERIQRLINTDISEDKKAMFIETIDKLALEYESNINAEIEYHTQLFEIRNSLPKRQWLQIREAFKIWKKENGVIQTELSRFQRKVGSALITVGACVFGASIIFGIFVILLEHKILLQNYFLATVCCLFAGSFMMYLSIPYYDAMVIQRHLTRYRDKQIIEQVENLRTEELLP